jgi:hypothetical protein
VESVDQELDQASMAAVENLAEDDIVGSIATWTNAAWPS